MIGALIAGLLAPAWAAGDVGEATPADWERAYRHGQTTAQIGAAMPLVGFAAGTLTVIGERGHCMELGCVAGPVFAFTLPTLAGLPVLGIGSLRARSALDHLGVHVSPAGGNVAALALPAFVVAAAVWTSSGVDELGWVVLATVPIGYAGGVTQAVLDARAWTSVPVDVAVIPWTSPDVHGARLVVRF